MPKLDAHQHFWDLERFPYPWLSPAVTPLYRNFLPADLAQHLAACGIDGTVVVQATHSTAETQWLLSLARDTPFIKGVVAWFDLTAPDLTAQLEAALASGPLCGVRHQVHDEPDPAWLLQEPVLRGLRAIAAAGLPYDLLVRPSHLPILPRLFEAVPQGSWVIDHIAKPAMGRGVMQPWLNELRRVARYENVSCKLSGLITEAGPGWSAETIKPYVDEVLELFGPARLMFGSDWPVCELAGSYEQVHDLIAQFVESLSPGEQDAIWSGAARRVYHLR